MDKETKAYLVEVRNSILDRVGKAAGKVIDGGNYLSDDRVLISLIDA